MSDNREKSAKIPFLKDYILKLKNQRGHLEVLSDNIIIEQYTSIIACDVSFIFELNLIW